MPGTRCTVSTCTNSGRKTKNNPLLKHVMYHSFPKDKELKKQWVLFCHRKGKWKPEGCRVCSEHFKPEDYERDLQSELLKLPPKKKLKKTAAPSLKPGYKKTPKCAVFSKKQSLQQFSKLNNKDSLSSVVSVTDSDNPRLKKELNSKLQEECLKSEEFVVEYLEDSEHLLSQEIVDAPETQPTQVVYLTECNKCSSYDDLKNENSVLKQKNHLLLKETHDLGLKYQHSQESVQLLREKLKEITEELQTLKEQRTKEHMIVQSKCDDGMYEVFVVMNHEEKKVSS